MISARVDGADTVAATLTDAGDDLDDLTAPGEQAGAVLVADARRRAPRRSGRLRASIRAVAAAHGATVSAGGARVPYAGVQEHGWRRHHIRGSHYLSGSADANADRVAELYGTRVGQIMDQVKGT